MAFEWARGARRTGGQDYCLSFRSVHGCLLALLLIDWFIATPSIATPMPGDANVLNVRDFGAKGDGATDDTAAVQTAIDRLPAFNPQHPWQTKIIYFPNGTYRVSSTLARRDPEGHYLPCLVIIGESQAKTVIRLVDAAPGFQEVEHPKSVIYTSSGLLGRDPRAGGKDYIGLGEGNDAYLNTIENITVEVGKGNPGAIGIDYLANNIGTIRDVTVRSVERAHTGLLMTRKWIGPALMQRVTISGFDVGIDVSNTEYSVTLDRVTIRKCSRFGLRNASNSIAFANLNIDAAGGVAVANLDQQALMTGISATISGRGSAAIENSGSANFKDINVSRFHPDGGAEQRDWSGVFTADKRIGDAKWEIPVRSMAIPDEATASGWANVQAFGAIPDSSVDSTSAIAAAFRSGAKTIYFPTGQYRITNTIAVPPSVEKIEGLFSTVFATRAARGIYPVFLTEERTLPLALRRLIVEGRSGGYVILEQRAQPPVIVQDVVAFGIGFLNRLPEGGSVFADNISGGGRNKIAGPAAVWFRQLNAEAGNTIIENSGASLWILGAKTEQTPTLIEGRDGSRNEVVGGLVYRVKPEPTEQPLFVIKDSKLIASYAEEAFAPNAVYTIHLKANIANRDSLIRATDLAPRGKFARVVPQLAVGD